MSPKVRKVLLYLATILGIYLVLMFLSQVLHLHYEPKGSFDLEVYATEKEVKLSTVDSTGTDTLEVLQAFEITLPENADSLIVPDSSASAITPNSEEWSENGDAEEYFDRLISEYLAGLPERLGKKSHRTDMFIRYYSRPPDGEKVKLLEKMGFYIHERPVDPELNTLESNSLFYGDQVSTDDIRIVAYSLLQAGLPIKKIEPSLFHDSWKAKTIEIGTDTTADHRPIISTEQLRTQSFN